MSGIVKKAIGTLKICASLFMARIFGRYVHSVGGGDFDYAVYDWRGSRWGIPTGPFDDLAPLQAAERKRG